MLLMARVVGVVDREVSTYTVVEKRAIFRFLAFAIIGPSLTEIVIDQLRFTKKSRNLTPLNCKPPPACTLFDTTTYMSCYLANTTPYEGWLLWLTEIFLKLDLTFAIKNKPLSKQGKLKFT